MDHQILIIEDDEVLANVLRQFLIREGYRVECAREREEAEVLLTYVSYSLVITDLSLTSVGSEGFDLLKFIAGLPKRPKAVVLTGHLESSFQREAQRSGAEVYLQKPVKLSALATVAHALIGD